MTLNAQLLEELSLIRGPSIVREKAFGYSSP